jgi:hypothetical protein
MEGPGRFLAVQEFSLLYSVHIGSWDPPSLLSNGCWEIFPWGLSSRGMKLTTHHQLVLRLRTVVLYLHSPLHDKLIY